MSNNKMFLIGFAIILLIIIVALYFKGKKPAADKTNGNTVASKFPLKVGSTGNEVRMYQTYLRSLDTKALPSFGIDSIFGAETLSWSQQLTGKTEVNEVFFKQVVVPAYGVVAALVNSVSSFNPFGRKLL